ncbi:MAG: hypothetical protein E7170_00675 [Firmicutes bacterium]|nr:hypothetical protein [Bacillota bacterium]
MNNQNDNIIDNTSDESVKIQYVNPLNPNEVLRIKNHSNVINETPIVEVKEEVTVTEPQINEDVEIKPIKKKKNKLVLIISALIGLVIILGCILVIPKLLNKNEEKPNNDNPSGDVVVNNITLQDIVNNTYNSTYYKILSSVYTTNITNNENSIVFDLSTNDTDNIQYTFELDGRNLKIKLNRVENNYYILNAIYAIADGIGQFYGHEVDEVGNYLYTIQNNYVYNVDGITTTDLTTDVLDPATGIINQVPTGEIIISLNIDSNINTTELSNMHFTIDDLNNYKDNILNSFIDTKKGNLLLYTNSAEVYTIIIGERKELTDNTYKTILNLIEILYPTEIEDFKSKFTSLSTIAFDKYKITLDPELNEYTYPQYQQNYKFVSIEITKQAPTM